MCSNRDLSYRACEHAPPNTWDSPPSLPVDTPCHILYRTLPDLRADTQHLLEADYLIHDRRYSCKPPVCLVRVRD